MQVMNGSDAVQLINSGALRSICRRIRFETGDVLRRKGQHYRDMYLITEGCVIVELQSEGRAERLLVSDLGAPIGEIGFMRGSWRVRGGHCKGRGRIGAEDRHALHECQLRFFSLHERRRR